MQKECLDSRESCTNFIEGLIMKNASGISEEEKVQSNESDFLRKPSIGNKVKVVRQKNPISTSQFHQLPSSFYNRNLPSNSIYNRRTTMMKMHNKRRGTLDAGEDLSKK